jgi:glycosyltransferase involved in cell wall biosynthesis
MARYLFVNRYFHPDLSPTSQLLGDVAFSLAAAGNRVAVITSRDSYCGARDALPARETIDGVRVVRVWTTRCGRAHLAGRLLDYLTFYVAACAALLRLARPRTVVVVKTDPPLLSVLAAPCAWLRGATLVNWLQDLFPEVGARLAVPGLRSIESVLLALRDASLRAARMNVVLGGRMRDVLRARRIPADRIRVLQNWTDGDVQPVPVAENVLRAQWGFRPDDFVVGYSGNMGRAHDMETFVAAAIRLRAHQRIRFLFVGGGAKRALVEQAVAAHGLGNVTLRDYQPRDLLAASLSVPDVHLVSLLPALEGLIVPCKIYGALAAGRPIVNVGDANGEVARLLEDSGAGVTHAVGDVDALCATLSSLAADGTAAALGAAGLAYSREHLRRDVAVQRWVRALTELAGMQVVPARIVIPAVVDQAIGAPLSR